MATDSVEGFFAQVNGTLEAVVLACSMLVATHPHRNQVLGLLNALTGNAADEDSDTEAAKRYKLGIRTAVASITKGVETARLAEEIRALKSEPGSH